MQCFVEWRSTVEFSINLLPQTTRRKERRALYLVPVLGVATVIATTVFLVYSYFDTKNSVQALSERITAQTTLRDQLLQEYQAKNIGVTESNFAEKYRSLNQLLGSIYVDTVDFHEDIVHLLPAKAEIDAYTYANNGDLLTTISFYSKGDSAIFLNRVLNADFVEDAEVELITAEAEEELTYQSMFNIKLDTVVGEEE